MKKILMSAVLLGSIFSLNVSAGMKPLDPQQIQQQWITNQQKCKQNIDALKAKLEPSDSKRRAAADLLRGAAGKDTKEATKEAALKKLNEFALQQQNDSSQITAMLTAWLGGQTQTIDQQKGIDRKIQDHAMDCDVKTKEIETSAASAF